MPKIRTITVYEYHELSEKAQERARNWYREAHASDGWAWDSTKEDAKNVGLELYGTDHGYMDGDFVVSASETIAKILLNHGKDCETYETAFKYQEALKTLTDEDKIADTEKEFLADILEDYRVMYEAEEEYQQSDEYIIDQIQVNGYEFTEEGKRT